MLWFHGTLQTDADFSRITRPLYVTEFLWRAASYAMAEDWDAPLEAWSDGVPMKKGIVLVIRVANQGVLMEAPTPRLCEGDPLDLAIREGAVEGIDYEVLGRIDADLAWEVGMKTSALPLAEVEAEVLRLIAR